MQDCGVTYIVKLKGDLRVDLEVYVVYDEPMEAMLDPQACMLNLQAGLPPNAAGYKWPPVHRSDCQKGCDVRCTAHSLIACLRGVQDMPRPHCSKLAGPTGSHAEPCPMLIDLLIELLRSRRDVRHGSPCWPLLGDTVGLRLLIACRARS